MEYDEQEDIVQIKDKTCEDTQVDEKTCKKIELEFQRDHSKELIIGSQSKGIMMRSQALNIDSHWAFLSNIEPKNFKHAKKDESWMLLMQE